MATFPTTKDGRIEYFEQRLPQWLADPAAIGLTIDQVNALAVLVVDSRNAYTAAQQGKQETKNLVFAQDTAIGSMMDLGSALVATIRAFADATGATDGEVAAAEVFSAANLSPNNPPSPTPPPAPATDLTASLLNSGGIGLTWKGTTANGTVYSIWRRTSDENSFTQIATSGERTYEDQTLPTGLAEVVYFLKTHRDDLVSDDSEPITVRLGVTAAAGGAGGGAESGSGSTGLGLAA